MPVDRIRILFAQKTRSVASFALCTLVAFSSVGEERKAVKKTSDRAQDSEAPVTLASILASTPKPRDYKTRMQCITKSSIRDQEVFGKRHIVFTMRGKEREKILVQFGRHCFGLNRNAILNLESRSQSRLCAGDYVRTEVFEFGRRSWGPRCTIPNFEPITDYQVELLKEALNTGRVE